MLRLCLMRHGESDGNLRGLLQGQLDLPLTARGAAQARKAAEALAADLVEEAGAVALYTSPLSRAMATAVLVGSAIGVAPVVDPDLAECDLGAATGLRWDEFAARYPAWAGKVESAGGGIVDEVWPGGETTAAFRGRCERAIRRLISRHRRGAIVVVTHGGPIGWVLAHLLGDPPETWPPYGVANGSITEVVIDGESAILRRLGDVSHLTQRRSPS